MNAISTYIAKLTGQSVAVVNNLNFAEDAFRPKLGEPVKIVGASIQRNADAASKNCTTLSNKLVEIREEIERITSEYNLELMRLHDELHETTIVFDAHNEMHRSLSFALETRDLMFAGKTLEELELMPDLPFPSRGEFHDASTAPVADLNAKRAEAMGVEYAAAVKAVKDHGEVAVSAGFKAAARSAMAANGSSSPTPEMMTRKA